MKTPDAIARIARIGLNALKDGTSAINPQAMRKMDSNNKPIFFVNFIIFSFSRSLHSQKEFFTRGCSCFVSMNKYRPSVL